ncbi:hypothetical protein H2200_007155 [Cladophialophora chaetospira]|uniref:Extracellular conserved serine-rich protein n=1 Tax=Cladophialophora chaetospira TaxID=386627 RepID=A0AA38X798_9EURO|nr:hypothetical protein H2200_007155 [Cladophialophora chaetospira]
MRPFTGYAVYFAAFVAAVSALKFNSPTSGSTIDRTQPIVISWSVTITDPAIFDLKLSNSESDITFATGVVSYTGTYTVPANTIRGSGSDYKFIASGNGITLGQITGLYLGSDNDPSFAAAGVTVVSTRTVIPTAASRSSGYSGNSGSMVLTASIDSVGTTTLSGIGGRISTTPPGSSFITSAASSASSNSSAATTTTGSTNTASGQKRRTGELVLSAAGVLAGVVALLA